MTSANSNETASRSIDIINDDEDDVSINLILIFTIFLSMKTK